MAVFFGKAIAAKALKSRAGLAFSGEV